MTSEDSPASESRTVVVAVFGGARQTWHAEIVEPSGLHQASGRYQSPHRSAGVAAAIEHAAELLEPGYLTVVVSASVSSPRSPGRTAALERIRTAWATKGFDIEFVTDSSAVAKVAAAGLDPSMSRDCLTELASTRQVVACDAAFDARDSSAAWAWADQSGNVTCAAGVASSSVAAEAAAASSALNAHRGVDLVLLSDCHSVVQFMQQRTPIAATEEHWCDLADAMAAHNAELDAFWIPAHCDFDAAHTAADLAARAALRARRTP